MLNALMRTKWKCIFGTANKIKRSELSINCIIVVPLFSVAPLYTNMFFSLCRLNQAVCLGMANHWPNFLGSMQNCIRISMSLFPSIYVARKYPAMEVAVLSYLVFFLIFYISFFFSIFFFFSFFSSIL
jgi:hypothetical protein